MQLPLSTVEQYKYAVNFLRWLWKNHGNERFILVVQEPFEAKDRWHDKKFHGMCGQIADETGNDARDVKEWALSEEGAGWFLDTRKKVLGTEVRIRTSWADLNEDQADYAIRKLEAWMVSEGMQPIRKNSL